MSIQHTHYQQKRRAVTSRHRGISAVFTTDPASTRSTRMNHSSTIAVDQFIVDQFAVDQFAVDQLAVDQLAVDQLPLL